MAPKAKKRGGAAARKTASRRRALAGPMPPYGDPIRRAITGGDAREMRRVASEARRWLTQTEKQVDVVRAALADLEKKISDL